MKRWLAVTVVAAGVLVVVVARPTTVYSHKPITTNILFKNEIAQIFQRKCFQCHSDNNLAMSLTTYTDARPWARAIREEILDRQMPPWQAVPGYGHFANDISLNTREKEIILSWTDGGAPSGVLKAEESIPPVFVPTTTSWDHGPPDLVATIGTHTVASGAPFEVKRYTVDTTLPKATAIRAISLKQGDRRVVRHAAFYDLATGRWIGGWTPWQTLSQFAGEAAVMLPAKARIAVEIGYSGTDADVIDTSEIGLYFANDADVVTTGIAVTAVPTTVAAQTTDQRIRAESKLATETTLLALWPELAPGARSIEVTALMPDGMATPLLWIKDYEPEWRSPYIFAAPVALPRGSRLVMTAYVDNPGQQSTVVRPQTWVVTAAASRLAAAPRK
jgi:hypothetical protein